MTDNHPKGPRRHRLPQWFLTVMGLVVLLWAGVTVYYRLGASGVRVRAYGAAASFDRRFDRTLLKINDRYAMVASTVGSNPSVYRYERGMFPFCPLCGIYTMQGAGFGADYRKGDWIYGSQASPWGDAVNVRTGEVIDVPGSTGSLEENPPAEFKARGLDFAPADKLTPEAAIAGLEPLSTINESCLVFTVAFMLIAGLVLLIGLVSLAVGRRTT
jgi:hypothetical protein